MTRRIIPIIAVAILCVPMLSLASTQLNSSARAELQSVAHSTGDTPFVVSARGNGYPRMFTGTLAQPTSAPAEQAVRAFVDARPGLFPVDSSELTLKRETRTAVGKTVRFKQTYKGLPVVGAEMATMVRHDGVIRAVSSSLRDFGEINVEPLYDRDDAAFEARRGAGWFIPAVGDNFQSRLVVLAMHGDEGRLAYEIHFGSIPALFSNLWIYVDARTGEILRRTNKIAFQYQGRAFVTNPGDFGGPYETPVNVDLDIPDGGHVFAEGEGSPTGCDSDAGVDAGDCDCPDGNCVWLSNPLYLARSCPDYHETVPLDLTEFVGVPFEIDAHMCSEVQTAFADIDGNFLYEYTGDHFGLDDLNMNDKFAEVQMFHHVAGVYNYYLDLMNDHPDSADHDWTGLEINPLMATVNFTLPVDQAALSNPDVDPTTLFEEVSDPYGEMHPFDNAMFMAGGGGIVPGIERPYDSIVFGQGTACDFGWDGDVIRHEFTHAIENSVSLGVGEYQNFGDEWGVNVEAGGMSEGFSDIFPAFMSDEPRMGEYSLASAGEMYVRDLSGNDFCPNFLQGEVHADSTAFSQSFYQARQAVAGDDETLKHQFEQATFVALSLIVHEEGFAEAAAGLSTALEDLIDSDAAANAEAVFADHGTDDCPRVIGDDGTGTAEKWFTTLAPATLDGATTGSPFTPGILQFQVTADDPPDALNMTFSLTGDTAIMNVIVRHDEPIQFSYSGGDVIVDDDVLGPFTMNTSHEFSLVSIDGEPLPTGQYYLMPVNVGTEDGNYTQMEAFVGEPVADGAGLHGDDDAGPESDSGTEDDAGTEDASSDSSGCGCNMPGNPSRFGGLFSLLSSVIF